MSCQEDAPPDTSGMTRWGDAAAAAAEVEATAVVAVEAGAEAAVAAGGGAASDCYFSSKVVNIDSTR